MKEKLKQILIVDDSLDLQFLLARLLQSAGYDILQAHDGLQALNTLKNGANLPCLILLDVMMPVMDGIEFKLKQMNDPRLANIPVVWMSADANSKEKVKLLGGADFIQKPILNLDVLLKSVERFQSQ